ncbi:hypothetical protein PUN28_020213 [Cardiocondyla obscurior]|uniref:Uncharacterized protein n=1 Tax=Cardiocondyla obscurior TaxID=286306 RepID=A0AAW2E5Q0_9HYME
MLKKKKLRKSGILPPSERSTSSSKSSRSPTPISVDNCSSKKIKPLDPTSYTEETRKALNFLEYNVHPWSPVENFWRATLAERKSILAEGGIYNYFKKFPALRIQEGYRLVSIYYTDINIVM